MCGAQRKSTGSISSSTEFCKRWSTIPIAFRTISLQMILQPSEKRMSRFVLLPDVHVPRRGLFIPGVPCEKSAGRSTRKKNTQVRARIHFTHQPNRGQRRWRFCSRCWLELIEHAASPSCDVNERLRTSQRRQEAPQFVVEFSPGRWPCQAKWRHLTLNKRRGWKI